MLRIPHGEPVLFASDMHLAPEAPRTAARFLAALRRHGPRLAVSQLTTARVVIVL